MKAYIRADNDNEFDNVNFYSAYYGFSQMGFEVEKFKFNMIPNNLLREDIVVGYISEVKQALRNLGQTVPKELDYPEELNDYYGRSLWKDKLYNIVNDDSKWPVFIKPFNGKLFDGRLVSSIKDLIGCGSHGNDLDIWCSSPIEIVSEWRSFIYYDKVKDVRPYKGDWKTKFDYRVLESALENLKEKPAAFTIDIGVTKEGRTIIVELNDGYSCGSYGLQPLNYAKFISARWCEMAGIPDICRF